MGRLELEYLAGRVVNDLEFIFSGGVTISLLNRVKDKTPVAQYIPAFGAEKPVARAFSGRLESDSKGNFFVITSNQTC